MNTLSIDRICTIGPASDNQNILSGLISKGMNIIRLNLSHGTHESHRQIIETARALDRSVKILGDLQGPKIRLGEVSGVISLQTGAQFTLYVEPRPGSQEGASVDYPGIVNDVKPGSRILINDGQVELTAESVVQEKIETTVKIGGPISSHKGVNLPGTAVGLPAITEKDKQDIDFLLEEKVDYLACSFVRRASHLQEVREYMRTSSPHLPKLIAKIETVEAIKNFSGICKEADGIMIARGDLGVEVPFHWIPVLQKAMLHECNRTHTYVIVATQMLQSMVESALPTRAEVTDVFQAVLDGANAVMLSAESASGAHPLESVATLQLVSQFAEKMKQEAPFDFEDIGNLLSQGIG
jgi:pyruvate kinase